MKKIKVLIVEDSAFMRKLITDFLSEDPLIEVIGIARNGLDAINKMKSMQPDVVTMDIEMPVMSGLDALAIIMKDCPVPIIMLSSVNEQSAHNTLQAMHNGAFDFIAKPSGPISLDLHKIKEQLLDKIKAASKMDINLLKKSSSLSKSTDYSIDSYSKIELNRKKVPESIRLRPLAKLVAIGTSTGGPRALQTVLGSLPKDIAAPIVIVQHMPPGFTKSLASRLDQLSEIGVKEAEQDDVLENGTAYIAPGGYHMKIVEQNHQLFISLTKDEARNGHRPSVDVMFESISMLRSVPVVAVVMTGMGNDGTKGLRMLKKELPVQCIAESEQTAIVFGMPKSVINAGLADTVEHVENIAKAIVRYC
ncbi:protein-glutamate methylesterase/protein-glutamine glutaminase [Bacillus testis]|uniref:protein-glutamate methylesterase/protein-glutamine glutaminase n=1 Tax=Bacillus testis TaxID=1622072 RepID=UPI00067F28F2|nr:chemotaxis response regulator protein-glutamate methylesterase [Bacillus testis]